MSKNSDHAVVELSRPRRWALILGTGIPLTLLAAGLAAATADERPGLTFAVFAAVLAPVVLSGAWALVPNPALAAGPEHDEDTVEHTWLQRALSGAFVDLVAAMGIAVAAEHVAGAPEVPLELVLAAGMLDAGLRYLVLARREG